MKTNIAIYWLLFAFFFIVSVVYVVWAIVDTGQIEWVGAVALLLSAAFGAMVAVYLGLVNKSAGGTLPEDSETADIDDGDPEMGHYSPWSWWPIVLAGALALVFLGIAVGTWITFIGVPLVVVALVGWVYEYYRGNFAR